MDCLNLTTISTVRKLLTHRLAESTQKTYERLMAHFNGFCSANSLLALPALTDAILHYLAHLYNSHLFAPTAQLHLASVASTHLEAGFCNPTSATLIRHAMLGYKRLRGRRLDHRLPIILHLTRRIKNEIARRCVSKQNRAAYWCAYALVLFRTTSRRVVF